MENSWEKTLARYDELVESLPFERKGKTVPYTSANGHMFSFINKAGEFGIRLGKEGSATFIEKYKTAPFKSHGAFMKGYVLIPDIVFNDTLLMKKLLEQAHQYVRSLEPK